MKLGEFLNSLATKAGVAPDFKALVDFLSRSDIANIDVNQDLVQGIESGLMNLDAAKQNPLVKSHFTALALNGIDTEILNSLGELGFGDDIVTEFKNEKNTPAKLRNLVTKVKEAQENLKKSTNKEDVKKYVDEIASLNQKLSGLNDQFSTEKANLQRQHLNELTDLQVNGLLAGKNYANKDLPADVNATVARTLLNNALQSKGVKLVNANGKLTLKRADDESLDYLENHKPVELGSFIDGVLAENKLLAVSNPATPPAPAGGPTPPAGGNPAPNSSAITSLDQTLEAFKS